MKTFLFRSMIGIFFGAFLSVILTNALVLSGKELLDGQLFFKNSLGSIFCGWLFTVTPLYYENLKFSLVQATALHFATVFIAYFILAFGIGWIPVSFRSFLIALVIFLVTYALNWLAFYLYFRIQAKKLNADLDLL